jgi:hypothetical protein
MWGSEHRRKHLEHELNSPNVNVWSVLTHERVIGPFFYDGDIITSNSFLNMLENNALLQLDDKGNTSTLFFYWVEHLFILLILSMTECEFSRLMDKKRTNCMASSFS